MLGNKSGRKYHSFYFLMHHANFFKTNMLNLHVKLVVLCFFFFTNLLFKEENVIFQFKCVEYEVAKYNVFPVSNEISRVPVQKYEKELGKGQKFAYGR